MFNKISIDPTKTVHFVLGNASADLDSIVSSLSLACLLRSKNKDEQYIPLINIYKHEIESRKDVSYLFKLLNICVNDFLFLDDVDFDKMRNENKLRLNLVDNNHLKPNQKEFSTLVESIIDHHPDENQFYPLIKQQDQKIIERVGSATTLVAEKIINEESHLLTPKLAAMLLAPILSDTLNLTAGRLGEKDFKIVDRLTPIAKSIIPSNFYEELKNSKNDVTGLTPSSLLNKDCKEYVDKKGNTYGISELRNTVKWWVDDESLLISELEKFVEYKKLNLIVLMIDNQDENSSINKRKVVVYSPDAKLLKEFDSALTNHSKFIHSGHDSNSKNIKFYVAQDKVTRKNFTQLFDN